LTARSKVSTMPHPRATLAHLGKQLTTQFSALLPVRPAVRDVESRPPSLRPVRVKIGASCRTLTRFPCSRSNGFG
jgi:hypothetical protein